MKIFIVPIIIASSLLVAAQTSPVDGFEIPEGNVTNLAQDEVLGTVWPEPPSPAGTTERAWADRAVPTGLG